MKEFSVGSERYSVYASPYFVVWNDFPQSECDSWSEARRLAIACGGQVFRRIEVPSIQEPDPEDFYSLYDEVEHRCGVTGRFVAER